ncbi:MAG: hypothetical protein LBL37_05110 [Gracilibacteraceae bacterium]|jgi:hypothetical protein|nr:hypothetical protein [Gracilibacteraceae bacterium]
MQMPGKSIDIIERNVFVRDGYDDVPNELNGQTIDEIIDKATELSMRYIEKELCQDPTNYAHPRGRKIDTGNWGFQYLLSEVPRLKVWCAENVMGSRIMTVYKPEAAILRDGQGLGFEGARLLHKLQDGKAVRRRKEFGVQYILENSKPGERWLNAPSGNNLPLLEAAVQLPESKKPKLITAVDYSFTDLRNAKKLAIGMGLEKIAREYRWRDLTDKRSFIKRQYLKKMLAPLVMKQRPIIGDADLEVGKADLVKVDGWFEYWLDDEKLARHLGEYLKLVSSDGKLIFDDARETHPQPHFLRTVLGWSPMAGRDLQRLHDKILIPNRDAIGNVECYNIDEVFRVIIINKS